MTSLPTRSAYKFGASDVTTLNQFTGVRTASLEAKLRKLEKREAAMRKAIEDGEELGGGSPFESLYEEMDAIEAELAHREREIS